MSKPKPQPNLNTTVGFYLKMTLHPLPPPLTPTTETQCKQYLSCYLPSFDKFLKVGSWEHLEQILPIPLKFVQAIFGLALFVHIKNISAVNGPMLTTL